MPPVFAFGLAGKHGIWAEVGKSLNRVRERQSARETRTTARTTTGRPAVIDSYRSSTSTLLRRCPPEPSRLIFRPDFSPQLEREARSEQNETRRRDEAAASTTSTSGRRPEPRPAEAASSFPPTAPRLPPRRGRGRRAGDERDETRGTPPLRRPAPPLTVAARDALAALGATGVHASTDGVEVEEPGRRGWPWGGSGSEDEWSGGEGLG